MNTSHRFTEPIIESLSSIAEEMIYSFRRRTLFSPLISKNCTIKCCVVTGGIGAQSESHTHPGDEIVFTLAGENISCAGDKEFILMQNQALAIPPQTRHTTRVSDKGTWKGVSFYCDQCPLLHRAKAIRKSQTLAKTLSPMIGGSEIIHRETLFSPLFQETHFMELFALQYQNPIQDTEFLHKGETVYYVISGSCDLTWQKKAVLLAPDMAAAIPAGLSHSLTSADGKETLILAGSCSACSLLDTVE